MTDKTNPPHYTRLSPQPIDVIRAWNLDFCTGNIVKYAARAGFKEGDTEVLDADAGDDVHLAEPHEARRYVA